MRLWSVHPKYLDAVGLVALWREALLAQNVLKGETKGYTNHPQLERFKNHSNPQHMIANYLHGIWEEAEKRGYDFNVSKIGEKGKKEKIPLTRGQLRYEFEHLCDKLRTRNPDKYRKIHTVQEIECHPIFEVIEGRVERWEKTET